MGWILQVQPVAPLSITDLNASQHEGNYTVVVSNAFGSVTSSVAQIDVNGSLTEGLVGWWKFDETEGNIASRFKWQWKRWKFNQRSNLDRWENWWSVEF